jgi:hypothetical protein
MLIPTSWLFAKGDDSVWIYRPNVTSLLICGPKRARLRQEFPDEDRLEGSQADLASDLQAAGWELLGEGCERRRRDRDARRVPSPAMFRRFDDKP